MLLYKLLAFAAVGLLLRWIFVNTDLFHVFVRWWRRVEDRLRVYQSFKIPELNADGLQNLLFRQVSNYVSSLTSLEDSDFTNLLSGKKSNDIVLEPNADQIVHDSFLGSKIVWVKESGNFVLKIRRKDKRRILQSYLQYIHTVSEEIEEEKKDLKLHIISGNNDRNGRWRSVQFTHPASLDTLVMDSDLKNKLKSDLETFTKSKQYYHRLGRVWKRSYLLCGPSGTGKSSFIAAMANFLNYNIYDFDLSQVPNSSTLKSLLLETSNRSVIVVEDLDKFLIQKSASAGDLSGILNFMDGMLSASGGDGRVMVYTMSTTSKEFIDSAVLRPGRVDVHVNFPLCDFISFKLLADSYLGVKDHKLFPRVEEMFMTGASLSPAEVGELMIVNRNSPSRAIKSVISALQINSDVRHMGNVRRTSDVESKDFSGEFSGVGASRKDAGGGEFKKLYSLLMMKSCKRTVPLDVIESTKAVWKDS